MQAILNNVKFNSLFMPEFYSQDIDDIIVHRKNFLKSIFQYLSFC